MGKPRKPVQKEPVTRSTGTSRDETIAQKYSGRPSPRALFQQGQIDREAFERPRRYAHRARPSVRFAN